MKPNESKTGKHMPGCPLCSSKEWVSIHVFDSPPDGETHFDRMGNPPYWRELLRCGTCGHFINRVRTDLDALYEGDYVEAKYGSTGLQSVYERIMAMPPEESDNVQRVKRIIDFMDDWFSSKHDRTMGSPSVLDVGSGLGVFPARMKNNGWVCTALDPDPTAANHARQHIGVEAECADFMLAGDLSTYDLITFNKVLEHVPDPVAMLRKSKEYMSDNGIVYVEVPDGEMALQDGPERQEFYIEHRCAFSMTSLSLLIDRCGFKAHRIERYRDPSKKYSLCAFVSEESEKPRRRTKGHLQEAAMS